MTGPSSVAPNKGPAGQPTAVITGASSGIGEAFARQLAAQGYELLLVARREDRLCKLRDELSAKHGVPIEVVTADLSKPAETQWLAERIGGIPTLDLLVNNAGFGTMGDFVEVELASQLDMIQVHLAATLVLSRAALPGMIARHKGAIINVASMSTFLICPGSATYAATKTAVTSFSESLQAELRATGVKIQALCPGFIRTGFHDTDAFKSFDRRQVSKGLWMSADDVATASLRALRGNRVICVPGLKYKFLRFLFGYRFIRALAGRTVRKKPKTSE